MLDKIPEWAQILIASLAGAFITGLVSVVGIFLSAYLRKKEEFNRILLDQDKKLKEKKEKIYLDALSIIENNALHRVSGMSKENVILGPQDTKRAREIMNNLIIFSDNQKVIDLFKKSLLGKTENVIIDVDEFRKLIKDDIAPSNVEYMYDQETTIIGKLDGDII